MRSPLGRAASAVTIAALLGAAAPAPARAQGKQSDPAAIEDAKKHMKAGAAFYNDPAGHKCEEALREFAKAYELSGSLNALKGMAICNLELERDGDAIEQYTAYLAGKGGALDAVEKAQVESDLNALKEAVARVVIYADKPGIRVVDVRSPARGFPIRNAYPLPPAGPKQIGVHPGQHVFTASLDGYPDQIWRVDVANGGTYAHVFELAKPKGAPPATAPQIPAARPVPAAVWVTAALTGALGIAWGVLAIRAKLQNDAYTAVNGKEPAAELAGLRSGVKTDNLIADVFLGATAAGLATTLIVYFTRPTRPVIGAGAGPFYLAPSPVVSGAGAVLGGSF